MIIQDKLDMLQNVSTKTTPDEGQELSIGQASIGQIIKTNGVELVKGTNMIENQSCGYAGKNVFVTEPHTTTNVRFSQCSTNVPQSHESDLGDSATFEQCKQRAADKGSNTFALGPNNGGNKTRCYVGSGMGGSGIVKTSTCSVASDSAGNRMGRTVPGKFGVTGGNHWWNETFGWISGYTAYAIYNTDNASVANLNRTYHINDNLEAKWIPNGPMNQIGVANAPGDFQVLNNFGSSGNDITNGSSNNIEEIKQKCIETPGCAGFTHKPSDGTYYLKNANMWPKGNRQISSGRNLYIREPKLNLNNSCNSSNIETITQDAFNYSLGSTMDSSTTCALGTISERDLQNINLQYRNLNTILEKIHAKIVQLGVC